MRVTFLGKGGSGKTTLATSFIKYLESNNKKVLAVDADINVHLGKALDMSVNYLGELFDELSLYFEKAMIKEGKAVIGTSPASFKSKFINADFNDEFFQKYATFKNDNLALLTVGTYTEDKVGYACYHSKLSGAIMIYNRLLDDKDFYVVTDATAGIDSVGTSMFNVGDINIFVVEPTRKSLEVYKDFIHTLKDYNIKTYVIVNKVEDDDDIAFIKENIDEKMIIGYVNLSKNLKKFERGNIEKIKAFQEENKALNNKILNLIDNTDKDWKRYLDIERKIYIDDAADWYSQYYNQDLASYIDKDFSYEGVINNDKA